jgi:hypothetical protein
MTTIRAEAIKNVRAALATDNLLPHKLLNLGQTYRVDEWVMTAITFFIKRREPIRPNDAEIIGVDNALKLASLRECCIQHIGPSIRLVEERSKMTGPINDSSKKRVEQLFGLLGGSD